jgi:ABC-type lipoprotein release transport system permease subunit
LEHLHFSIAAHQHFLLAIQTTEVEKETPKEEESPRAKTITAFLANQTQSILAERRQQRSPLDRLQAYSPLTWVQKQMNKIEMADKDHALTWKQVVEKALEEMNIEIWQYEKRTIITDAQSIALLVTTALFLLRTFVSLQIIIIVGVLVFNLTLCIL